MTRDEVRAAARRVVEWHGRFSGLFGRKESQAHSLQYIKELLSNLERKSVEPIALQFSRDPHGGAATQNEVVALQGFLSNSPWEAGAVFAEIQSVFAEELVPSTTQWPLGAVAILAPRTLDSLHGSCRINLCLDFTMEFPEMNFT
ncbi:MAG: transposase [Pirellulales bacterium]|nr:transposase [Pirellulales bacterium]